MTHDERNYLYGKNGIVWATYDRSQAETVQSSLQAQSIACEVREENLRGACLYLLHIPQAHKVKAAIDFIWRDPVGLRLEPDWRYPAGTENESYKKWVG
ncbi:MAG: hypothetical protein ACREOI_11755 [bacterium]